MRKIKVFTGDNLMPFKQELTPLMYVQEAIKILDFNVDLKINCNSPDFCSAIYYISKLKKYNVEVEFYINDKLSTLEEVFGEFNKALDLINEMCKNEE